MVQIVQDFVPSFLRAQVLSLVGEPRSCKLPNAVKNETIVPYPTNIKNMHIYLTAPSPS